MSRVTGVYGVVCRLPRAVDVSDPSLALLTTSRLLESSPKTMIPRGLRRANRGVLLGSFLSTETVQIPVVNLLKDHEERGNRRLDEAINRLIDSQKELKMELKAQIKADAGTNALLLRSEIKADIEQMKADAETNALLLRSQIKADIERMKADAETNAHKLRLDLEQKINSSFWSLLFGVPSVMGVVIAVFGYFGGTINISLNPEFSGGSK